MALNIVEATHGSGTIVRPFRWMPLLYDPSLFQLAVKRIGVRDLWETRRLLGRSRSSRLAAERATAENLTRHAASRPRPRLCRYRPTTRASQDAQPRASTWRSRTRPHKTRCWMDLRGAAASTCISTASRIISRRSMSRTHLGGARGDLRGRSRAHDVAAAERAITRHFKVGPIAVGRDRGTAQLRSRPNLRRSADRGHARSGNTRSSGEDSDVPLRRGHRRSSPHCCSASR